MGPFTRALNQTELDAYDVLPPAVARQVLIVNVPFIPGGYSGITLGTFIGLATGVPKDGTSALLAHELVHVGQWESDGKARFVWDYLSQFVVGLAKHRSWNEAYRSIAVEIEARSKTEAWCDRCLRDDLQ